MFLSAGFEIFTDFDLLETLWKKLFAENKVFKEN